MLRRLSVLILLALIVAAVAVRPGPAAEIMPC